MTSRFSLYLTSICICAAILVSFHQTFASIDAHNDGSGAGVEKIDEKAQECGVWLAMSTLPGTGIGLFAGRNFTKDERLLHVGDHTIPIVDMKLHQGKLPFFLWDSYTWSSSVLRAEGFWLGAVNVASPGIGAAANSFLDFVNVEELNPSQSVGQSLHRSKDPGVGAFSYFHSRHSTALKDIVAGQELFVDYGNKWFVGRAAELGPVPIKGDHLKAEQLLRRFEQKLASRTRQSGLNNKREEILQEFWKAFVLESSFKNESRVLAALPALEDYEKVLEVGLIPLKEETMSRSTEWLQQNGACVDGMYFAESTIPQAGHGVFAGRFLSKDSTVLPVPLIHIPNRTALNMYEWVSTSKIHERDTSRPRPPQLLLNYCLGHRDSTLLLSPYGPVFNLINHNRTQANVKLRWADPVRSQHNPDVLEEGVDSLHKYESAVLAMELVALRDINPNEEIFLDYGDEWESAWLQHVRDWQPVSGAGRYVSAVDLDSRTEEIMTEFEQLKSPYPPNVMLKYRLAFDVRKKDWKPMLNATTRRNKLKQFAHDNFADGLAEVEVLKKWKDDDGNWLYRVVIPTGFDRETFRVIKETPRESLVFQDRPYTTDQFLPNTFRHDIRIPDDIFPEAWKNKLSRNGPPKMKTRCGEA